MGGPSGPPLILACQRAQRGGVCQGAPKPPVRRRHQRGKLFGVVYPLVLGLAQPGVGHAAPASQSPCRMPALAGSDPHGLAEPLSHLGPGRM